MTGGKTASKVVFPSAILPRWNGPCFPRDQAATAIVEITVAAIHEKRSMRKDR
jgi:hypothetical protein